MANSITSIGAGTNAIAQYQKQQATSNLPLQNKHRKHPIQQMDTVELGSQNNQVQTGTYAKPATAQMTITTK
ncbi:MAG: hypothetical protein P4N59_14900 [Negativicutes bacterium]|nr:hypothetical protein [Negativicutes bacterium]